MMIHLNKSFRWCSVWLNILFYFAWIFFPWSFLFRINNTACIWTCVQTDLLIIESMFWFHRCQYRMPVIMGKTWVTHLFPFCNLFLCMCFIMITNIIFLSTPTNDLHLVKRDCEVARQMICACGLYYVILLCLVEYATYQYYIFVLNSAWFLREKQNQTGGVAVTKVCIFTHLVRTPYCTIYKDKGVRASAHK